MNQIIQETTSQSWMEYMRNGDFELAWKYSDAQLKARAGTPTWHLPRHFQSIWDGSSLKSKRILVRCYHGLGDTIQFIRYMPLLKHIAKEVIVWAQEPLLELLKSVAGIDRLLPLHDGTPGVEFDADIEIMELPYYFRTTVETIPANIPYLYVAAKKLAATDELNVGLVWKAGGWDERRDIAFSLLQPLAHVKGINLIILQADAELAGWQQGFGNYPGNFNLDEYAQVLRGLDLLITIDSMPAHLAGALGVRTWTLLQYQSDWRWLDKREDGPWYPTMRLFRQEVAGEWELVIERVVRELQLLQ
jgi:hypothetical protein